LPTVPLFHDAKTNDKIQEIALRVIVELPGWEMYAIGTACLVAGHLAITARHVVEAANRLIVGWGKQYGNEISGGSLRLLQVLPGPVYRIWNVYRSWLSNSDIAILHFGLYGASHPEQTPDWKAPVLRLFPPPTGQNVVAFGYRESKIDVTETAEGGHHIEINDIGTTSAGEVGQVFVDRRDVSMLTFPCFEVNAQFAPGMSGGMVVDEEGRLSGLVCASYNFEDPTALPLSYAATLWPMLAVAISADRSDAYPRGVSYPMIDLALDGQVSAVGLDRLNPEHFPGRKLPSPPTLERGEGINLSR
jgi:Trypsin-like peptidase domain